ncbi:DUF456 domain-containing protein [Mycolicibacterium brumae]|uniref:DUF456 domain-containing protein n=1 Tax=Mycolicibacterium brumae TaxID=85968 RepID=A0A2G5PFU3_9MYCO|nr:DUF456 domain-containing protein [Mycolicibacterium brumae]MCV7194423.1 DUF456 domain-containing protein [Mycolicibacterium brumae]PIB77191.1 DUF456 domain-containing protein [Mycolicibacterium brumae]RWA15426.1 hypothetical protein MBRU_10275 [Mycolicibacterium brumae DSM 44177]UWW10539.1 DUF456 domain-containing protein [Mycolicibacterium brumae]
MSTGGLLLVGLAIAVGLVGVVVPLLPGGFLVLAAITVWACFEQNTTGWVTLGVCAALIVTASVVKYLWPAKRMRAADVGTPILIFGALCGIVGFFAVPVIGLVIGFVGGVFVGELVKRRDLARAWAATVFAVKGVLLSMGVEFAGALLAAGVWAGAVLLG